MVRQSLRLVRRLLTNSHFPLRKDASFSTAQWDKRKDILADYRKLRKFVMNDFTPAHKIKAEHVFAVNKTDFSEIEIFGFDYDYTLAEYSDDMQEFIYRKAASILLSKYKYPEEILNEPYLPDYCIRGLHYDIKRALIMKVDERHIVQMDTVRKGRQKLSPEDVEKLNIDSHIPKKTMDESCKRGNGNLQQLTDIFSIPEVMLLANVIEYFNDNDISYDPFLVFDAVENAVKEVHTEGHLHEEVKRNIDQYLKKDALRPLISKLERDKKKLFLLTNSRFPCVDVGMRHMLGPDWRDAFELVLVDAKKPEFFDETGRPFKTLFVKGPSNNGTPVSWAKIKKLEKGKVYSEGCCSELMKMKGWDARKVLYFGDQIYADLQSPNQSNGWSTCAVIHELKREIDIMNENPFVRDVVWVQTLEKLTERMQEFSDKESRSIVREWLTEREERKTELKTVFNENFGSVFRSALQGSYFSARLCRVADIYTSSVMNLLAYPRDKIFFPPRGSHPHEQLVGTGYQHDGFDSALVSLLNKENPEP